MPRPEKVQAVAEIKEKFEAAEAVFLTEYRGIAVKQMGDLRRQLRDADAEYKVVKMTLARRAAEDLGIEGLSDEMVGPTALTFANGDPVGVAKALSDFSKDNERLVIKLGLLADKVLQPEDVAKLAAVEPREVLLAKIAGAAKAPLSGLAGMLSSFTRDAATVFTALLEKKESDPAAQATDTPVEAESSEEETAAPEAEAEMPEAEVSEAADDQAAAPTETDDQPGEESTEDSTDEAEEE